MDKFKNPYLERYQLTGRVKTKLPKQTSTPVKMNEKAPKQVRKPKEGDNVFIPANMLDGIHARLGKIEKIANGYIRTSVAIKDTSYNKDISTQRLEYNEEYEFWKFKSIPQAQCMLDSYNCIILKYNISFS